MKKILSIIGFTCAFMFISNSQVFADISEAQLKAFGQKLYDIHARQAKDEYLALIHPNCPDPIPEAIEWTFSNKWLTSEEHAIRVKEVSESYDLEQLIFEVKPEAALEFQTWMINEAKDKKELVTVLPIAKYKNELRVLDYPCFKPK